METHQIFASLNPCSMKHRRLLWKQLLW